MFLGNEDAIAGTSTKECWITKERTSNTTLNTEKNIRPFMEPKIAYLVTRRFLSIRLSIDHDLSSLEIYWLG